jgi:hypothetical protein
VAHIKSLLAHIKSLVAQIKSLNVSGLQVLDARTWQKPFRDLICAKIDLMCAKRDSTQHAQNET